MLYIILAYIMLFPALFDAVCLYNACLFLYFLPLTFTLLFIQIRFVLMLCLWLLTLIVYFQYYFALCTVLLITIADVCPL